MAHRRRRTRKLTVDAAVLVERALKFESHDEDDRSIEMEMRLQRYAKYRQWNDDAIDERWEDATNTVNPDIMTTVLRVQDTLYNAALAQRPMMTAKSTSDGAEEQESNVTDILDYQGFVENGEDWLSDIVDAFTIDGHFTAFIPWVDEKRDTSTVFTMPPIPEEVEPTRYFLTQMQVLFPEHKIAPRTDTAEPWDFVLLSPAPDSQQIGVSFYTMKDDSVEAVVTRKQTRFLGPKIIVKDRSEVLHPVQAENLQIPGPSNPGGATHVIMKDIASIDSIKRNVQNGFYDRINMKDVEKMRGTRPEDLMTDEKAQRVTMEGGTPEYQQGPDEHEGVTRLQVFDTLDINGDGIAEDVVYWIAKEPRKLLRMRLLAEAYPSTLPERPFAEQSLIPVRGRRTGISLPEMLEGLHDFRKMVMDQLGDYGSLSLSPFFFYRPTSSMKPETIKLWPGEGYPLSDPSKDVNFPNVTNNQGASYGFNALALTQQQEERLTLVSDLNLGRVPAGKSSALRTVGGISLIQGQGEARPERVLRRFFMGLSQVWRRMHELNKHMLQDPKVVRLSRQIEPGTSPYKEITPVGIRVDVDFEFEANVFNTSRAALQEATQALGPLVLNPLMLQSGIVTPRGIFNLSEDITKAWGQDPERYFENPQGIASITAEEAVADILDHREPFGLPEEGAAIHMQKLMSFAQTQNFLLLDDEANERFSRWIQTVQGFIVQEQERARLAEAQASGESGGEGGGAAAAGEDPNAPTPVGPNELLDETLPSAGGGGNTGAV